MTFVFNEWNFWVTLILIAAVMGAVQGICAYLILAERKISAWAQDRVGPNRVGSEFGLPFGLLQPIADGVKFLLKEQVIPGGVDVLFYLIAPCIAVSTALMAIAVVPFGPTTAPPTLLDRRTETQVRLSAKPLAALTAEDRARLTEYQKGEAPRGPVWPRTRSEEAFVLGADAAFAKAEGAKPYPERLKEYNETLQFVIAPHVDIGIVFVLAVGSLGAYAIILGGWSSNNKYSLIGSMRSSAQLISYEIPMGLSILGVMLVTGSLNVEKMIDFQHANGWNVLFQPVACLLFVASIFAECNRVPFDLPEAEQELVGGYHTEYSGMKFALFFLGEYTHMITTSFLAVALFFGGWLLPGVTAPGWGGWGDAALKLAVYGGKMLLFVIFYMYIRWTLPRFRFDQLMALAWKVMMPLALVNLLIVFYVKHFEVNVWWMLPLSVASMVAAALLSLRVRKPPTKADVGWSGHPVTGRA
ncbi:MAG: complex I subunit 1/NuoH family protein [Gemmataceae bacterium]